MTFISADFVGGFCLGGLIYYIAHMASRWTLHVIPKSIHVPTEIENLIAEIDERLESFCEVGDREWLEDLRETLSMINTPAKSDESFPIVPTHERLVNGYFPKD